MLILQITLPGCRKFICFLNPYLWSHLYMFSMLILVPSGLPLCSFLKKLLLIFSLDEHRISPHLLMLSLHLMINIRKYFDTVTPLKDKVWAAKNTPSNHTCLLRRWRKAECWWRKIKLTLYHLIKGGEVVKYNQAECKEEHLFSNMIA